MFRLININKEFPMKTLIKALSLVAVLSIFALAENIDGTLAVDALEKYNVPSDTQLSAGLNDNNGKNAVEADSMPASTGTSQGYVSAAPFLEGPFVGFEISPLTTVTADGFGDASMSYGLRFGAQNTEWRTMAVLEKMGSNDDNNDYVRGLLQLDYFFLGMDNLMLDTYAIRPYVGINAGIASVDTAYQKSLKTLTYGAEAGASMNLTNQLDLDVSYRYNLHSSEYVDSIGTATIGLHYKY